jgi:predicted dehydrogenase
MSSLQDALARKDVHIVSICAEPRRRGRIILQAAKAGKHLYLDKPLAGSLKDADAIAAETAKMGVVSHMFSGVRSETALRVRQLLESGDLGDLTAVHFDLSFAKGPAGTATLGMQRQEAARPERFESRESKRELSNVGVYPVVMLMWLLGQKVRSVYATTGNYFFAEHQKNNMEDFGQMLLELDSGIISTLAVGRTGWRSHPGTGLNRIYLIGSKGTVVVDTHRPRVEIWADEEPWKSPERNPEDPMGMWEAPSDGPYSRRPKQAWITPESSVGSPDAAYFLDCIEQGRESDVSASVAALSMEVLLAAYRSAATGEVVQLPLPR